MSQIMKTSLFRKILLGAGVATIAGVSLSAAPAMAHDRDDRGRDFERRDREDRGRDFERRDRDDRGREFQRRDRDDHREFRGFDRDRFWVADRYEFRRREDCGRIIAERVLCEPGHWVYR